VNKILHQKRDYIQVKSNRSKTGRAPRFWQLQQTCLRSFLYRVGR